MVPFAGPGWAGGCGGAALQAGGTNMGGVSCPQVGCCVQNATDGIEGMGRDPPAAGQYLGKGMTIFQRIRLGGEESTAWWGPQSVWLKPHPCLVLSSAALRDPGHHAVRLLQGAGGGGGPAAERGRLHCRLPAARGKAWSQPRGSLMDPQPWLGPHPCTPSP